MNEGLNSNIADLTAQCSKGDFDAWTQLKPLLEKQTPDAIEPLLKQTAMQGHLPFIKEMANFYLDRAGISRVQPPETVIAADEAKKMHLHEPAYVWFRVLEGVGKIEVSTYMREAELKIKMRHGTNKDWGDLEASLISKAQALIDEINKNIIARLEANINSN